MARATKAEYERRIDQVDEAFAHGARRCEVMAWATTRWGVSPRQVDNYIKGAHDRAARNARVDRDFEISQALRRLSYVIGQAIKEHKPHLIIKAQHEIDALLNLRARGDASEHIDAATLRANVIAAAAEFAETGGLDGIC